MVSVDQALDRSSHLAPLLERMRLSQQCLAWIRPSLPPPLRAQIQAGPLEDGVWCLLVANPAIASKLRQLVPRLQTVLGEQGVHLGTIRIKVQAPTVSR